MTVEYRVVMVGPELAALWLSHNDVNRQIKRASVEKFARDMKLGAWAFYGTPVLMSEPDGDGHIHLLDGQNRLTAIVQSGTTQPFMVFFNMPIEVQAVVDSGNSRSIADTLHMAGHKRAAQMAAAARILYGISTGPEAILSAKYAASNTEVIDLIHQNPRIRTSMDAVEGAHIAGLRYPVAAVMWYLGEIREPEMTSVFFKKLISGVGLEEGEPVTALLNRLRGSKVPTKRTDHQLWLGLRALNMTRAGKAMERMVISRGGVDGKSILAEVKSLTSEAKVKIVD